MPERTTEVSASLAGEMPSGEREVKRKFPVKNRIAITVRLEAPHCRAQKLHRSVLAGPTGAFRARGENRETHQPNANLPTRNL